MTQLSARFAELRTSNVKGLVPFITAGDPDLDATQRLIHEFERAGVDAIELGVPFTDPLADGPTIQASSERALASGTTLEKVFELVRSIRQPTNQPATEPTEVPLVLMTYYNPMLQYNLGRFAARCRECGVDGIIATDLPPEEAEPWIAAARKHNVGTVFLLAPTSTDERLRHACELATGFIYCVSRLGVTGARETVPADLGELIGRIRRHTDKPIAAGFGFSTPEQVRKVLSETSLDAVVVGSAIVNRIAAADVKSEEGVRKVGEFVRELKAATRT